MKPKFIQYGSQNKMKKMIIFLNKFYNKINIKQNKYFSYCGEEEKNIFTTKIKEKQKMALRTLEPLKL